MTTSLLARSRASALKLDHRTGFLLSMIDGASTVHDLLDVSGMPSDQAIAILADLVERRIVSLEPR